MPARGIISNNLALFAAALLTIASVSESQATSSEYVWIEGYKYPGSCKKVVRTRNGRQEWGVFCPRVDYIPEIEDGKRKHAPSLGGFASRNVPRQPMPSSPEPCYAAIERFSKKAGAPIKWLRTAIYGHPKHRFFTQPAARYMHNKLESYSKRAIRDAENMYQWARRGENATALCVDFLNEATIEVERIHKLLVSEAAKGNRDLDGTGLNPYASDYNQ